MAEGVGAATLGAHSSSSSSLSPSPSSNSAASAVASSSKVRLDAPPPPTVPPWASLASGAASGAASCLLLQPMDLLKTRMQQQQQQQQWQHAEQERLRQVKCEHAGREMRQADKSKQRNWRGGPGKRTARLLGVARQIVHDDGWQGLWRGTVPTVARNVPGVALYFYSVSEIRALLSRSNVPILSLHSPTATSTAQSSQQGTLARLTVAGNLTSGAVARVAVGFVLSPVTIVKARFESSHFSKHDYPTLTRAIAEIYEKSGVRGLFRGFSATALRDAPYAGLYLAIYEKTKDGLARMYGGRERGSSTVVSASGIIAGTLATLLTHPFDILKTRIQTMPEHVMAEMSPTLGPQTVHARPRPPSLLSMTRYILANEGGGAFLDGLGLRCARKAASSAIGWTIFEGGRGLWVRNFEARRQREQAAAPRDVE